MDLLYSPSTRGFYSSEIHEEEQIPFDAIAIPVALYEELLRGESTGKIIMPPDAEHLLPWLADTPPLTEEELYLTALAAMQAKYEAPYDGKTGGLLTMKLMELQAAIALDTGVEAARAEYAALLADYSAEMDALEAEYV